MRLCGRSVECSCAPELIRGRDAHDSAARSQQSGMRQTVAAHRFADSGNALIRFPELLIHIETRGYPRFYPALQRAHAIVALVHQGAGDTRRAGFVGSTAIDHHVTTRRNTIEQLLD
jgi:hypothetical protein